MSGVFATILEADLAKRGVARGDSNSESQNVTLPGPLLRQLRDLLPHIERELDSSFDMIGTRDRIVEDDHDAAAGKPFQRAFISEDELSHAFLKFLQDRHDLFGFGRVGEGGETAQLAE